VQAVKVDCCQRTKAYDALQTLGLALLVGNSIKYVKSVTIDALTNGDSCMLANSLEAEVGFGRLRVIYMQAFSPTMPPPNLVNVLGVGVSAIHMKEALARIAGALESREKGYICVTGVHGVSEAQRDAGFRSILNRAFLNTPDGMPLVWVGRWQGQRKMDRVYGPDLMLAVIEASEKAGWRHFFYGGANGTAELLKAKLLSRFPKLQVVGTYEPPFRPLNDGEQNFLREQIRAARPDMMWVGLSTPKQERFMAEYLAKLDVTLMAGVGAAFDFHAGKVRQAPRWMQRSGLEWFYRLCSEPRRLWKRYLKNNPLFVARIFCQLFGLKKYSLPQTEHA
jgi:N-acetylglucosaminyldiphosphoundecaprenol N-acetyl-beta-D-mannosaminyltransferase